MSDARYNVHKSKKCQLSKTRNEFRYLSFHCFFSAKPTAGLSQLRLMQLTTGTAGNGNIQNFIRDLNFNRLNTPSNPIPQTAHSNARGLEIQIAPETISLRSCVVL